MRAKRAAVQQERMTWTAEQRRAHAQAGMGKIITGRITKRREGKRARRGGGNNSSMAVVWVEGRNIEGGRRSEDGDGGKRSRRGKQNDGRAKCEGNKAKPLAFKWGCLGTRTQYIGCYTYLMIGMQKGKILSRVHTSPLAPQATVSAPLNKRGGRPGTTFPGANDLFLENNCRTYLFVQFCGKLFRRALLPRMREIEAYNTETERTW